MEYVKRFIKILPNQLNPATVKIIKVDNPSTRNYTII
jgi:hypothetical protein